MADLEQAGQRFDQWLEQALASTLGPLTAAPAPANPRYAVRRHARAARLATIMATRTAAAAAVALMAGGGIALAAARGAVDPQALAGQAMDMVSTEVQGIASRVEGWRPGALAGELPGSRAHGRGSTSAGAGSSETSVGDNSENGPQPNSSHAGGASGRSGHHSGPPANSFRPHTSAGSGLPASGALGKTSNGNGVPGGGTSPRSGSATTPSNGKGIPAGGVQSSPGGRTRDHPPGHAKS